MSPTERTTLRRLRARGSVERDALFAVLAAATVCHIGVMTDAGPLVLPTAFGVDRDGPDDGGTLYLHGSVASASLAHAVADMCVTVTVVDGLVLARSAFHHSMNYRSAVIRGRGRPVGDTKEKSRALECIVEQVLTGRSSDLRPNTARELAATRVVAVPLAEASVKSRAGGPVDDASDVTRGGVWAGVVPVRSGLGPPERSPDLGGDVEIPPYVTGVTTS